MTFRSTLGHIAGGVTACAVLALLVNLVPPSASAGATTTSAAPALAQAVASGTTTAARVTAIDNIMAALNITVMNPLSGKIVVPGAARTAYDDYLYTNEVKELAVTYAEHTTFSLTDAAAALNQGGYKKVGLTVGKTDLGTALLSTIATEESNGDLDSVALGPRLVRELGLLHNVPQDLSTTVPLNAVRLDPLQMFLLVADFTMPVAYALPAPTGPVGSLPTMTGGIVKAAPSTPAANPCAIFQPFEKPLLGLGGAVTAWAKLKNISSITNLATKFAQVALLITEIQSLVHMVITDFGVDMTEVPTNTSTSLGGPSINFVVHVQSKLPPVVVDCGALAFMTFPPAGPVPGVKILWTDDHLSDWGTESPATTPTYIPTDSSGNSTLTFTPTSPDPVQAGNIVTAKGSTTSRGLINIAFGNIGFGIISDLARTVNIPWFVNHHALFPKSFGISSYSGCEADSATGTTQVCVNDLSATGKQTTDCNQPGPVKTTVCNYTTTLMSGTFTIGSGGFIECNQPIDTTTGSASHSVKITLSDQKVGSISIIVAPDILLSQGCQQTPLAFLATNDGNSTPALTEPWDPSSSQSSWSLLATSGFTMSGSAITILWLN